MAETPDFVRVTPEILSDNSVAWNVEMETVDGDVVVFDCVDEKHAENLATSLRECTSVEVRVSA
jgi:hypothetical protein